MKPQDRCPRISNETWKAPGGQGSGPWPTQTRQMQGRCTRPAGHDESYGGPGGHTYGDWLERGTTDWWERDHG